MTKTKHPNVPSFTLGILNSARIFLFLWQQSFTTAALRGTLVPVLKIVPKGRVSEAGYRKQDFHFWLSTDFEEYLLHMT